jgi:hypothetical protein
LRVTSDLAVLEELASDAGIIRLKPRIAFFAQTEADVSEAVKESTLLQELKALYDPGLLNRESR